ncbi:MAG: pyridoxamine 5'-phosphate oxidase family protein [Actinomycetota bacterium]|nr:pyridoxamine 5'-phosphate oxidase family protein [Actinomycetota bacterium]
MEPIATTLPFSLAWDRDERPQEADPTPWSAARANLAEAVTFWLSTSGQGGRSHTRPVLAVLLDDRLHFCSSQAARKSPRWRFSVD